MSNNEFKINLPQQAIDHYNQKADELLLKLEPLKKVSTLANSHFTKSHLYSQTLYANDVKDLSMSSVDQIGNIRSKYFHTSSGQVGLSEIYYENCRILVEELSKKKGIKEKVNYDFIHDTIFNWFEENYNGRVEQDQKFLTYLSTNINDVIEDFKIAMPIPLLLIEKPFKIGNIEFGYLREKLFDEIEKNITKSTKSEDEMDSIKRWMIKIRKNYQSKGCAFFMIRAEKNKAIEIAVLECEKSLAILNFFSKAAFFPKFINYVGRMGQIVIPESHIFVFRENLPEIKTGFDELRSHYWHIDKQELNRLRNHGIEFFSNMLANEEKTELEELCFTCITHYSKAISYANYYDRLVQLITSLEILLLKDRTERIQENVGRRLTLLSVSSTESPVEIISLLDKAYERRASYIHHGGKSSVIEILAALQLKIWVAIEKAMRMTSKFKTKNEFIEYIDRKNPPK